mgnify:CR=1 FL=1
MMDTTISANAMGLPGSGDKHAVAESIQKSRRVSTSLSQDPQLTNIQTMKDAKRAELQGEYIPISEEQLIKAIERAIKSMEGSMTALEFSIHESTKQVMVKVINKETGEVIREIPPERNLDFLAKVWEKIGILIDEKR